MDPCSIFGLVTTCVTIAGGASRLVHQLHSLRTRLQSVDVRMQLLETQVRALKTATANISEWLKDSPEDFGRNEEPAVDLGAVLEACDTLILLLQEHASKALSRVDRLGSIDLQAKIKTLWEEDDIKELQELLRNQVQSLNLMLQCFQLPSRADRRAMLTSADMRESIKKAQDTSSSLRWLMDDESCLTEKTTGTRASNCLDHNVTFDFDAEVMGSRVYRDTFASMIGNDLRGGPKEMPLPSSSGASLNEKTQAHRTSENRMSEKPIPGDRNTFSTILHTEAGRQRALDGLLMTRNTMKATELLQRWISPESHTAVVCENAIWILQTEPQCESEWQIPVAYAFVSDSFCELGMVPIKAI
ncbi:hypothetical protein P152DRAFT_482869 [Eremomyces bilateralis CBS 781.70]|uniref:Fungal N-terminal domain-containing protein n=1 Tax=Eremomyces bilateralis CBS 781.70 TaxID=1392243 RepID=A0A6G1G1P5_9PEZI|nr:uncharacterized protein P152DRAFT_482869 [Eremomyces bilateralis CBS 781.70]KAF1811846.1 hypothetical protein P152DRAFT_482869 [Eremomyces bilateralis CBS 781.70]